MSHTVTPAKSGIRIACLRSGLAASIALSLSFAVHAEDTQDTPVQQTGEAGGSRPTTLDTIQVTAQFRSQNMQETPIAITAVNAEMMEARGQVSVLDIAQAAPSVNISPTVANYGSGAAVSIRGVGQYDSNFALEPGVGIYIDDVYHPTVFGSVFDLLDLERVEILRGPQGTLAGKNSIGGAVKLFSRVPDEYPGGFVEATYGSFGRLDLRAGATFTLSEDRAFMRLSGVSKRRDGYSKRYDYGCMHPGEGTLVETPLRGCEIGTEGGTDFQGVRAALRFLATDKLELNVIADAAEDDSEPVATKAIFGPDPAYVLDESERTYYNYSDYTGSNWLASPRSKMSSRGISAKIDYRFDDRHSLTSITAYRDYDGMWSVDMDGGPISYYTQSYEVNYRMFSQELRFNGAALDDKLQYTLGGYYFDGNAHFYGIAEIPRLFALHDDPIDSDSKALFANAIYTFNDRFDVAAGIRYTEESKTYGFSRRDPVTGLPNASYDGFVGEYSGDRFDYRLSGSFHVSDRTMLYASYATGFKGGGINPRPFAPTQVVPFNPETLTALEVGVKSDLLDRRLRLNASIFDNSYDDILVTISTGYGGFPASAVPVNAGEAKIRGAELEVTAYPVEGLSLDASYSYLDFEYTHLSEAALASRMNYDLTMPYLSRHKASLGVQYEFTTASGSSLIPRLDTSFQSSFFTNASNSQLGRVKTKTVHNARLTWRPANADWETSFAVTNLFDKYYYLNKIDVSTASGVATASPARPREWSVTVKYNF